jgi:hypothetical protein
MQKMKIARVHSHLGGLEFLKVRLPNIWSEIESAIAGAGQTTELRPRTTQGIGLYSSVPIREGICTILKTFGWMTRRSGGSEFAKDRTSVEIRLGRRRVDICDLYARQLALYIGKVIDVGVEILPMKSLQQQMSSGIGYYEGELYNLIREGRGVPAVPLILIGICPD